MRYSRFGAFSAGLPALSSTSSGVLRVLHLATWYPTKDAPHAVPFIKAHFDAVAPFGEHRLVHAEVTERASFGLRWHFGQKDESRALLTGFRGPTRLREWLTLVLLTAVRVRLGRKSWDVIAIHVAWPAFRFPKVVRWLFGSPVVIIEHWSAYASDFHLDPNSKAHARMRKMFSDHPTVIAVSEGLARDIAAFAQRNDLDIRVVPNVVDDRFYPADAPPTPTLFMAANWNRFRRPFLVLDALPALIAMHPDLRLVIAGGGPQLEKMKTYVTDQDLSDHVTFLGFVQRDRIAEEMRRATLFVHPTTFETFSVVTAEAMCCGTPVLVSNVGALPELVVPGETGELTTNEPKSWRAALLAALDPKTEWDRQRIAKRAGQRFTPAAVARQLNDILSEVASQ